ncbi:MAG TPA: VWA domain-containing protein [Candidatus Rubrimentiphilum sp.]|nr:VWA domain-containing protein [Candidatus Rubrimentiphilum sp.]
MTFAHPVLAFLAALSLPFAFVWRRMPIASRGDKPYRYSNLPFMTAALRSPRWPIAALDLACALALSLLLAACAGPRLRTLARVPAAVVFCIDTSGSMNARDVLPSRARAAAIAIRSFAGAMPSGTRAGIVAFAGDAQPIVGLTAERDAIIAALARIPAPNGQTAIGDGLLSAASMLPDSGPRAIVLITDGANNHGEDPRDAGRTLASSHIRLNAIIMGDAPFSQTLRSYALKTGIFFRVRGARDLTAPLAQIADTGFSAATVRDCTVPFTIAALCVGAAAWLAAAGAGRP